MYKRIISVVLTTAALLVGAGESPARAEEVPAATDSTACEAAGIAAEQAMRLPSGVLLAIGRVESGRRDPGSGRVIAWPWTIDAAGSGQSFANAAAALAATRALLAKGVVSIDVGCFQINLAAHPDAFETLQAAFDPATNGRAAARLLAALEAQTGDWAAAIAAYHSATPERGARYRQMVLAEWGQLGLGQLGTERAATVETPPVLRVLQWSPTAGAPGEVHVWHPSGDGDGASVIKLQSLEALPAVHEASLSGGHGLVGKGQSRLKDDGF